MSLLKQVKEKTVHPSVFFDWVYDFDETTLTCEPELGHILWLPSGKMAVTGVVGSSAWTSEIFPKCDAAKTLAFVVASYVKIRNRALLRCLFFENRAKARHVAKLFLPDKKERFFLTYPICFFPDLMDADDAYVVKTRLEEAACLIEKLRWRTS